MPVTFSRFLVCLHVSELQTMRDATAGKLKSTSVKHWINLPKSGLGGYFGPAVQIGEKISNHEPTPFCSVC